MSEDIDFWIR
jgi:hypothetical protein